MQVFKTFWKIALKCLPSIFFYFVIFAGVVILISSSSDSGSSENTFDTGTNTKICIMDEDKSGLSKALSEYILKGNEEVKVENSKRAMQDALFYRRAEYILQIPAGFEESFVNRDGEMMTNIKIPGSKTGQLVDGIIEEYLSTVRLYSASGLEVKDAIAQAEKMLTDKTEVTVENFSNEDTNSQVYQYYSFLPYALMMTLINGICVVAIVFNQEDVKKRMECSYLKRSQKTMQFVLGYISYSVVTWILYMIVGIVCYGNEMFSAAGLKYMLNSLVFTVVTTAIAFVLSAVSKKQVIITMISNIVGLGMCFMCGVFVPQWMLGDKVVAISKFLPAYWYTRTNNFIGGKAGLVFSNGEFMTGLAVQLLFAVALFITGFVLIRSKKIERA